MAKEFAREFYDGPVWRMVKADYKRKKHGICERCGRPGKIVHHKIPLTPANINDDRIAYDENNLELLCQPCHNREHMQSSAISEGLDFDAEGNVVRRSPQG